MDYNDKIYFAKSDLTGEFIAIEHGTTGYSKTTVYDQTHADVLNERQGNTAAQIKSAVTCSMFGCWENFDKIASHS